MSRVQIIFTGDQPDAPLSWVIAEEDRVITSGGSASLADFATTAFAPSVSSLVVVLPGERFAARHISTPAKNRQQLMQSARFLLEDEIAGPTENLHLAVSQNTSDEIKTIIAVEKKFVTDWLAALQNCQIRPDVLTTDFLCLGIDDAEATILIDDGRLLFHASGSGFVVEQRFGIDLVRQLCGQMSLQNYTLLIGRGAAGFSIGGIESRHYKVEDHTAIIKFYSANIFRKPPPNLLQGELEPGVDWPALVKPWRQAAVMIAASIVLFIGALTFEAIKANAAADRIMQDATQRFSAAYPETTIRDLRRQARQFAGPGDAAASAFLDLTAVLTSALENNSRIELSVLSYDQTGFLVADVQFATIDDLDALKKDLEANGIGVEEGRTLTPVGNVYSGKLTLRAGT